MLGAAASLLVLLALSAVIGQALIALSLGVRRGEPTRFAWVAPGLGLGAMLALAAIAARLPGEGLTALGVLLAAALAAAWWLRGRVHGIAVSLRLAGPVVAASVLVAALPFAIAGNVGVLGAGLVNDDMASHLLIADYVREPAGYVPSFVRGGYPTGPHALVVALSEGLGAGLVEVFAGLTVGLAPITAMVALGPLGGLGRGRRILAAVLVPLAYLGIAYLSQGAFKEPLQALLLISFAVLGARLIGIPTACGPEEEEEERPSAARPVLRVLPLAVLGAASVFNYSLPGLLLVAAVAAPLLAARLWIVHPRPELPPDWKRRAVPFVVGGMVVLALATAQEWSRIADFARLEALNPDRAGSALGNLKDSISPLEALGIWPAGDYRTSAARAGAPTVSFYLGATIGLVALGVGLAHCRRRDWWALPAALAAIFAVWVLTALFSTPYIAAKSLAIAAPVVMLIAIRGLLSARSAALGGLALVFVLGAGLSSFLVLRAAPVRPEAHSADLAEVRELVAGDEVLFLGRDDFIAYELRGSDEITGIVTNFYSVEEVRPRFQRGPRGGEKFDVDAVFPRTLEEFRWILSPAGGPRSVPPQGFDPVVENESYVLWERTAAVGPRRTLREGVEPGAVLDCDTRDGRAVAAASGTGVVWRTEPEIEGLEGWTPTADPTDAQPARTTLELTPGRWLISLSYDSRRPLRLTAPEVSMDEEVAANLDFRGPSPFFPVGEIEVGARGPVEFTAEVAEPNLIARLLGAPNQAHLRSLSATPLGATGPAPLRRLCDRYVDSYLKRNR